MSSTFSNLKFELIGNGEQSGTWGTTTNSNIGTAIEQAIVGMATLEAADFTANVCTLTLSNTNAAQDARALCLNIAAGAVSAAGTINVPAIQKPYLIINGSSFAVTVKVSGQTGVAVPAGARTVMYNNGTDVGAQINWLSSLTLGTALGVASGGTGAATLTANNVLLGNGTSAVQVVAPGTAGNVLTSDGTTWASTTPTAQAYPGAGMAVSTGTAWATSKTTPTGDVVGTSDTQTLTNKTFGDPVIYPAGSAAAPAITTSGDTNTGIFFPAADTIAFSEGGAESARIDSSGNLLVGATSNQTGAKLNSAGGVGTANTATNRFATVEYGSGANGTFTIITVSFTVNSDNSSVILEVLMTGFGAYLDHVAARCSNQTAVVMRNNASAGTTVASLAVDGTITTYTLTITTSVTYPVVKVKATVGGLGSTTTLPTIAFA